MKKYFLSSTLTLLLFLPFFACEQQEEESVDQLPNIVFLLIDDLGINSVPFYQQQPTSGSFSTTDPNDPDSTLSYSIPHLYNLSKEARIYTNMYATALCAPSRGTLITGRYPFRTGIVNPAFDDGYPAIAYANNLAENNVDTLSTGYLNTSQVGYPAILRAKGYNTVFAGKWNLRFGEEMDQLDGRYSGDSDAYVEEVMPVQVQHLNALGFDATLEPVALVGNTIDYYPPQLQDSATIEQKYMPNAIFNYMAQQLTEGRNTGSPQYLHYCFGLLHDPFKAAYKPGEYGYAPPPTDAPNTSPDSVWVDKIQEVDMLIGQFIAKLDSLDSANGTETLLIIAGDNGTEPTYYSQFNGAMVEGGKSSNTSMGSRVPFMVRWPGNVTPGIDSTLLDFTDILPTMVELVNGEDALDSLVESGNPNYLPSYFGGAHYPPTTESYILDGQSFLNELTDGALGQPLLSRKAVYQQTNKMGFVANHDYMISINTNSSTKTQYSTKNGFFQLNNITLIDSLIEQGRFIDKIGSPVTANPFQEGTQEYDNFEALAAFYNELFPLAKGED